MNGHLSVVKFLVSKGADINSKNAFSDSYSGSRLFISNSILYHSTILRSAKSPEIRDFLIENGAIC